MPFDNKIVEEMDNDDVQIEVWKHSFTVLLLGSGYPDKALEERRKAKEELVRREFKVLIMEDIPNRVDEDANAKFRRILSDYQPVLFLILTSQSLPASSGVTYEVSLLVERHGKESASNMIRMCVANNVDMRKAFPLYVRELDRIRIREFKAGDFENMIQVLEDTIIACILDYHSKS